MDKLEKIQEIINEIKTTGFKDLSGGVRLSKKHLKTLNLINAELTMGGDYYSGESFSAKNLISDNADEAFDKELINKILTGEGTGGLGQFKTSNMENIGNVENIGGAKSKQIFKQSAGKVPRITELADGTTVDVEISRGLSDIKADIDIAKRISKVGDDVKNFSDNELRLTSQYKIAKSKGLSDAAALRVTKSTVRKKQKLGSNILETLPSANRVSRKAAEISRQAEKDLSYLEKESGLYGDKYFGPADSHVKEHNLTSIANQSDIGKQIPFTSGAEVREYNQMIQEFDKIEYSPAEKQAYYSGKRIDDTELDNLESSKVGLTGAVNPTDATQTNPMAVENYGDMKIGGGFTPKYMEDLDASVKIEYEKAYGNLHPINTLHPTEGKLFSELGFNVGDRFVLGITKKGKTIKGTIGPELSAAKERMMGSVAFGKDDTEPRFDPDVTAERASKTRPGQIETYTKSKKDPKPTSVPNYNPITDRPRTITGAEYKTQQSLVGQMNQLRAMYPNVANKNNLVRLAVRNMEKQLGLPANRKLLLNLSKFF